MHHRRKETMLLFKITFTKRHFVKHTNSVQLTQITVPGLEMQYSTHSTSHRSQGEHDTAIWSLSLHVVTAVRCTAV